jgi:hypothetical protein
MGGAPIRMHRSSNAMFLGTGDAGPRLVAGAMASAR